MDLMSLKQYKGKAFTISVREHELITDMHQQDGGDDLGLNPTELFAASIAACIGMIVVEYCRNHQISATGITLDVVPQLIDKPPRIGAVAIDLTLPQSFPDNRKKAVWRAIRQCVIYRTLAQMPEIDVSID